MSANLIDTPVRPNHETWKLCAHTTSIRQSEYVDAALLYAVATRATNCKATTCKLDGGYFRLLNEVVKQGDVHAVEWLKKATIWEGAMRGRVAKYRYLPHLQPLADKLAAESNEGHLVSVMFSTAWGIAQEPGIRIVADVDPHLRVKYLETYKSAPSVQLMALLDRLHVLVRTNYKSEREGLVKFYKDFAEINEVEQANRTVALAQFFRGEDWKLYARQGY